MSNMSEDIQYAGSDTRPPMLDRTDFESWQQRIRLYCLGKDNGENIMKSITEGPFQMGTMRDTLTEGGEGRVRFKWSRKWIEVFTDPFLLKKKERFITEVKLNRGLKESNFDQLYAYLKQHEEVIQHQLSESPQSSNQPSIVDNCQMDTGSTSTDNLIESLTNTLALLN
ncbi:hypothetical protein Tco_0975095 [Tanacetum coccineum]|uniref:Integrase, catalytic region, zinc finger, CCHC-type, peptidase aspartic, catalytic n=1 Tax=Tanacetum coccineum TaxID=301880 RepID=A0ABQ5EDQ8_9ASTR